MHLMCQTLNTSAKASKSTLDKIVTKTQPKSKKKPQKQNKKSKRNATKTARKISEWIILLYLCLLSVVLPWEPCGQKHFTLKKRLLFSFIILFLPYTFINTGQALAVTVQLSPLNKDWPTGGDCVLCPGIRTKWKNLTGSKRKIPDVKIDKNPTEAAPVSQTQRLFF